MFKRSKEFSVGKTIGLNTWLHKSYEGVLPNNILNLAKKQLPENFEYTVIKYNSKTGDISFIWSPDFDTSDEPLVGDSVKVASDGKIKVTKMSRNPLIYHHKWLMVKDDYKGFNVNKSIARSQKWKSVVGKDKKVSNRIGRQNYWLQEIIPKIIESDVKRSGRTAMSRKSISRPTKFLKNYIKGSVLHHGCGKATKDSEFIKKLATYYAEYDPTYASDRSVLNMQYDVIVSNYVMNTLPVEARKCVWRDLVKCTKGVAYITVRQDKINGIPADDGYITSKGTFQKKFIESDFLIEAKHFFTCAITLEINSGFLMLRCSN